MMVLPFGNGHCLLARPFQRCSSLSISLRKSGSYVANINIFQEDGVENSSAYISLLRCCTQKRALQEAKLIHTRMNKTGFQPDVLVYNTLATAYVKCGSLADARKVFDKMTDRNVCSWSLMISAYSRQGSHREALALLRQMQNYIEPNHYTFTSAMPACGELKLLEQGMEIHEQIIRYGYERHGIVANAMLDMYAKCGNMENARQVFDKMPQRDVVSWTVMIVGYMQQGLVDEASRLFDEMPQRDVASWNAMIVGFAQNGFVNEAVRLFEKMPQRDVVSWNAMISGYWQNGIVDGALRLFREMPQRDAYSWNAMIAGFAQNGLVNEALKLFHEMPRKDVFSWTAMITGFSQNGLVNEALKVFKKMPEPNVVSWNAMIAGLAQNGHTKEALKLFQQMQLAGVKPDSKVFPSVLSACANLAALEQGMEIHNQIVEFGFQYDTVVKNALIDMYAKCGNVDKAHDVFIKMNKKTVVSWSALIGGYAIHGYGVEAIKLFEQMKESGVSPNYVTFLGVLSGCSHAGLVDEGYQYFNAMKSNYRIRPNMEHYRCMVDLLGRAGLLREAQDFIYKMPIKPDASVWNSLLSACRLYNRTELAKCLAEHIFELDYKDPSPYVLLSNIYAAAGMWDDMENIRNMMKVRGVRKTPGCSWIEVNKQVHAFYLEDRSHPESNEIYAKLDRLLGDGGGRVHS